jgi:hypothetical protein
VGKNISFFSSQFHLKWYVFQFDDGSVKCVSVYINGDREVLKAKVEFPNLLYVWFLKGENKIMHGSVFWKKKGPWQVKQEFQLSWISFHT